MARRRVGGHLLALCGGIARPCTLLLAAVAAAAVPFAALPAHAGSCASTLLEAPEANGAAFCEEVPLASDSDVQVKRDEPHFSLQYFEHLDADRQYQYGHFVTVDNPRGRFSIVPPAFGCGGGIVPVSQSSLRYGEARGGGGGGAGGPAGGTSSSPPSLLEAAALAAQSCVVATNAGFFNTTSSACYGNLVSDGAILATSNARNVHFGVRGGKFVTGYLTDDEALSDSAPFEQLVGGVVWLVRDGVNYVHTSATYLEDMGAQETGDDFVSVKSARSAVGHDTQGRLVLFQVEGRTRLHGVDLPTFADILVSLGVSNAINLDGGSSATMVEGATVTNYPAGNCYGDSGATDPRFRCPAGVTSITCVHSLQATVDESGHDGQQQGDMTGGGDPATSTDSNAVLAIVAVILALSVGLNLHTVVAGWRQRRSASAKREYELADTLGTIVGDEPPRLGADETVGSPGELLRGSADRSSAALIASAP